MKLAIVGTHGSGKSTLVDAVATSPSPSSRTRVIIPEVPRLLASDLEAEGALRRDANTERRQALIILRQIAAEAMAPPDSDTICDRSVIDHWAYSKLFFPEWTNSPEGVLLFKTLSEWVTTYDKLYWLDVPDWGPINDGLREDDRTFQELVASTMLSLYESISVPLEMANSPDLGVRVAEVNAILSTEASRGGD